MPVGFTVRADRPPDPPGAGNIRRTANAPGLIKPKLSESCQIRQVRNASDAFALFASFYSFILAGI